MSVPNIEDYLSHKSIEHPKSTTSVCSRTFLGTENIFFQYSTTENARGHGTEYSSFSRQYPHIPNPVRGEIRYIKNRASAAIICHYKCMVKDPDASIRGIKLAAMQASGY